VYVIGFGPLDETCQRRLYDATAATALELTLEQGSRAMRLVADRSHAPCALVAQRHANVLLAASMIRTNPELRGTALIAFVERPTDSAFLAAFDAGADDAVLRHDGSGLERRLRRLGSFEQGDRRHSPQPMARRALVAARDGLQRRGMGLTLRQAGFDVTFAATPDDLSEVSRSLPPALFVSTPSFPPRGGQAALQTVREATRRPDLPGLILSLDGSTPALAAATAPGHHRSLAFLAEQLLRASGPGGPGRRSERVLHRVICSFRRPGMYEPNYACSHDISREGIYIQTLDAPPAGTTIWLETRTHEGTPLHLRGKVTRSAQSHPRGALPKGFGLELDRKTGPSNDLRRFAAAYERLARSRRSGLQ